MDRKNYLGWESKYHSVKLPRFLHIQSEGSAQVLLEILQNS